MIAERPVVTVRLCEQRWKIHRSAFDDIERAPCQKRLACDQASQGLDLAGRCQRASVSSVQFFGLFEIESLQLHVPPDVERRLIQVADEKVGFGGVADNNGEAGPWSVRLGRAAVVPRSNQAEEVA